MKKYLIVSGDSFTKGHRMGDKGSWAYHTAKKMNLELINLSDNGMGNEWISNTLLLHLYSKPSILSESIVMIGWTDFARELLYYNALYYSNVDRTTMTTATPADIHLNENGGHSNHILDNIIKPNIKSIGSFIGNSIVNLHKTYFSILHTKAFLENNNIPYLFFDAVADNQLYFNNDETYLKGINDEQYQIDFNQIEDIEFIQSYKNKNLIDYIFDSKYIKFENTSIFGWISKPGNFKYEDGNPGHTNELGADYISNIILNEYEKLYNQR
jgi:hypothetical protein